MGLLVQELTKADFCDVSEISSERALRKPYSNGVIVCEVEGKNNYRLRLEKDIEANRTLIEVTERKLAGSFATHAKSEVVESERQRLLAAQRALKEQEQELVLVLEN
jgi:valyl-tRNA synthetase